MAPSTFVNLRISWHVKCNLRSKINPESICWSLCGECQAACKIVTETRHDQSKSLPALLRKYYRNYSPLPTFIQLVAVVCQ
jgi:hypothetical protein